MIAKLLNRLISRASENITTFGMDVYFRFPFKCQFEQLELILKQVLLMMAFETNGNLKRLTYVPLAKQFEPCHLHEAVLSFVNLHHAHKIIALLF